MKKTQINKVSNKKQKLDKEYSLLRKKYLSDNPFCEANLPGCQKYSTDIHHKKGRGEFYLDITTFLSVCRKCHVFIETHPIEAKELNLSINRLN